MLIKKSALLSLIFCLACGCETTTLVEPEEVGFCVENGTVTEEGRFFFIGQTSLDEPSTIFELVTAPDGSKSPEAVATRKDCLFTGLTSDKQNTLYAACTFGEEPASEGAMPTSIWSDLFRVDLTKDKSDPAHIASTRLRGRNFYPNGMAVDGRGDIYISNSLSTLAALSSGKANPAVIRVRVVDKEQFKIKKKPVVSMAQGGLMPNGLQIDGDRLWFVSGSTLYEAQITKQGLRNLRPIYIASMSRTFDDFAVLPENNLIVISDIPTPLASLIMPNASLPWPSAIDPSQLTYVSIGSNGTPTVASQVMFVYELDPPMLPSSATFVQDDKGPALYVTDFFNGGLYRVGPTEQ